MLGPSRASSPFDALTDLTAPHVAPVIVAAVLLLLALWLGWQWARWRVRRRLAQHRKVGARAERKGLALLRRSGFHVVGVQVPGTYELWVDGRRVSFSCRADALVRRGRRTFLAEIKGGAATASVEHRATRRQLLEYALAYDVDGFLLVDVPHRRIHEIHPPVVRMGSRQDSEFRPSPRGAG